MTRFDKSALIRLFAVLALLLVALPISSTEVQGAPAAPESHSLQLDQLPDWLSAESASRLNVGIDVLVPSYLPSPFGGEPEITASDGYYSLYWVVPGVPPTYLQVTGEAGGTIPDFSYYDRNVQLVQNETVLGYPAWHDQTPIYDLVYFQVGNVVYTVDSHNLAGDSTLGIANSLMSLVIPAPESPDETDDGSGDDGGGGEDTGGDTGGELPDLTIGASSSVNSGEVVSIGINGFGNAIITTDWGYFVANEDFSQAVSGGTAIDWQAPYVDADTGVTLTLIDSVSGEVIDASVVMVQGEQSVGEVVESTLACTDAITTGRTGRILVYGAGTVTVIATEGVFPIEPPNTSFSQYVDGSGYIGGEIPAGGAQLSLLAPEYETTIFIEVTDPAGTLLGDCAIDVVTEDVDGDLNQENADSALFAGNGLVGDGSAPVGEFSDEVARVLANPIGFAGDASGGPEANSTDYNVAGMTGNGTDESASQSGNTSQATSSAQADTDELAPVLSPNGMVAQVLGSSGGSLECPPGAVITVPAGAVADQTTVALQPVTGTEIGPIDGIRLLSETGYDLTLASSDGRAVEAFQTPVELSIALQDGEWEEGARIYRLSGTGVEALDTVESNSQGVTAATSEHARFVVGVPTTAVAAGSLDPARIAMAGVLLVVVAGLGYLLFRLMSNRQRPPTIGQRAMPHRARYH